MHAKSRIVPESSSFQIRKSLPRQNMYFFSAGFCSQSHSNRKIVLWIITLWTLLFHKKALKKLCQILKAFSGRYRKTPKIRYCQYILFKFSSIFSDSLKWIASFCNVSALNSFQLANCDLLRSPSDNSANGKKYVRLYSYTRRFPSFTRD